MTTQSISHKPSGVKRMAAAIKRLFTGRQQGSKQAHQLSEAARMELALAIAEQYVLVSQDHPGHRAEAASYAQTMKSDTTQTLCSPTTTCKSDKSSKRESSLFGRIVRRPRTASYESTIFGTEQEDYMYCDLSFMVAASREQPICC
ncbi:hypothetical protein GGI23_001034 [Coemansia sp. RSA 2559]|nr:hypothetical protein GGI23_001034 [Coemansia sp. RSA 2559]